MPDLLDKALHLNEADFRSHQFLDFTLKTVERCFEIGQVSFVRFLAGSKLFRVIFLLILLLLDLLLQFFNVAVFAAAWVVAR